MGATTGGGTYSGAQGTSDSALAFTGSDALQLAAVAGLLLASGALLVGFSRRGRRH
jgi:LPXTG-motif cell wall-anchored protein